MTKEINKKMTKRLCVVDFDGCLFNTPEPLEGKPMWEKHYSQPYPHKGWWGRKESLDTNVFDIKPIPSILNKLKSDVADKNTVVIILTSRMEKLRPEIENILKLNNIVVDEVIMKKGREDKGDVILKIADYNPDLEQIDVYDDFAGKLPNKITELTKIMNDLPYDVQYNIYYVENGNTELLESTNNLIKMIQEEINNLKQ